MTPATADRKRVPRCSLPVRKGLAKGPLAKLLAAREVARQTALDIANAGDADERDEVEKRYFEQSLFTLCASDAANRDVLRAMLAICKVERFDLPRRNRILGLGLPVLEWRLMRGAQRASRIPPWPSASR